VAPTLNDADLRALLAEGGRDVRRIDLPRDKDTGRVRGVAFVRMGSADDARAAIRGARRESRRRPNPTHRVTVGVRGEAGRAGRSRSSGNAAKVLVTDPLGSFPFALRLLGAA